MRRNRTRYDVDYAGYSLRLPGPRIGWSIDAKNVELRIPAFESGEQKLIDLFEKANEPPYYGSEHLLNFSVVFPEVWDKAVKLVGIDKAGPYCKQEYKDSYYQWTKNGDFGIQWHLAAEKKADLTFHRNGAYRLIKQNLPRKEALNQSCIDYAKQARLRRDDPRQDRLP